MRGRIRERCREERAAASTHFNSHNRTTVYHKSKLYYYVSLKTNVQNQKVCLASIFFKRDNKTVS